MSSEKEVGPARWREQLAAFCNQLSRRSGAKEGSGHGHTNRHHGFCHEARHLLVPAIFIACLVHLVHGVSLPLEVPARLVVSNLAAHWLAQHGSSNYPGDSKLAILKIDRLTFKDPVRYGGRSPLDRCKLKLDLRAVLAQVPALEALGIDFDLSPTGDKAQDDCANEILATLKDKSELTSTVILPVDSDDRKDSGPWREWVRKNNVQLADPLLQSQLGMARQHVDDPGACPSLGVALASLRNDLRQSACLTDQRVDRPKEIDPLNIAFHRLALLGQAQKTKESGDQALRFDEQIAALKGKDVTRLIIGPGYDQSDEFLTPLGMLNGVDVHAAIALEPHETHRAWLDILIDIVLGVLFGAIVHRIWARYFDQRLGSSRRVGHPGMAYKWLLLLLLLLLVGLLVLPAASTAVTVLWGTWISPAPMLIGMTVDALVTGSVTAAVSRLQAHAPGRRHVAVGKPKTMVGRIGRFIGLQVPTMLWLVVVGAAFLSFFNGESS
jgi:hypothetical protein